MLPWPRSWKETSPASATAPFKRAIHHCQGGRGIYGWCLFYGKQGISSTTPCIAHEGQTCFSLCYSNSLFFSYCLLFSPIPFVFCGLRRYPVHFSIAEKVTLGLTSQTCLSVGTALCDLLCPRRKTCMSYRERAWKDHFMLVSGNRIYFKFFNV